MDSFSLYISGMKNPQSAQDAQQSLNNLPGIIASVLFEAKRVDITSDGQSSTKLLIDTLSDLGFNATESSGIDHLQIAIIGTGSSAFAAAIKAAENGAQVTLIERDDIIGGCCVNTGCVPSKILIRAAELAQLQRDNPFRGLANHRPNINRRALLSQQLERVKELRASKYEAILASNVAINLIKGEARFESANRLIVTQADGSQQTIRADRILIASGASPAIPPIESLSATPCWTSNEALFAEHIPHHLLIIGSSVIAVEIAQAYRRLGAEVTLLARHQLLYNEDLLLGERLQQAFEKEGIKVVNQTQFDRVSFSDNIFNVETNHGIFTADKLLVATGRQSSTAGLNLESIGVKTQANGAIVVDNRLRTSVEHIYAAGDCSNLPQYVYVAAAAGTRAATNMTGGNAMLDLSSMPAVIFTDPQVATVGMTEIQARIQNIDTDSRTLALENVPRSLVNFEVHGFIKLVAERSSGRLIGAQILASQAGEMIQTAALAIHQQMTISQLARQLFPYLTMVEGIKLCAQTFEKDVSSLSCCAG